MFLNINIYSFLLHVWHVFIWLSCFFYLSLKHKWSGTCNLLICEIKPCIVFIVLFCVLPPAHCCTIYCDDKLHSLYLWYFCMVIFTLLTHSHLYFNLTWTVSSVWKDAWHSLTLNTQIHWNSHLGKTKRNMQINK